jgi:hypothetical protein
VGLQLVVIVDERVVEARFLEPRDQSGQVLVRDRGDDLVRILVLVAFRADEGEPDPTAAHQGHAFRMQLAVADVAVE